MSKIGHNNAPSDELLAIKDPIEYLRYLVRFTPISTTAKAVGHEIVCCMKKDGSCWPSIKQLMANTGIKDSRTMTAILQEIECHLGLIIKRKNGAKNKYFAPQPPAFNAGASDATTCKKPSGFDVGGQEKPPTPDAGGSRTYTRARSLSEKNINPPHSPPLPSNQNPNRDGVCVEALPEGFEPLGHGAIINCETIQHPAFTISIPAVDMQFQLTPGCHEENARKHCMSFALQWAAAIEAGEEPFKVIPNNITRAISGSVTNKIRKQEAHENKLRMEGKTTRKVVRG